MTPATLVPLSELRSTRAALARVRSQAPDLAGLDTRTSKRVSTVVAAIAPRLATEQLALLTRYALWSITLDDRIDPSPGTTAPPDEFAEAVTVAAAGRPSASDPLLTELADIVGRLSQHDPTGAATTRCTEALRDAVVTGIAHHRLGRAVTAGHLDRHRPPRSTSRWRRAPSTT